jgi:hypothetical protein
MSDVDRLLQEYIAEHRAGGEADPRSFLSRASPSERLELAALIDGYLVHAPRQTVDLSGLRGSAAERTVDELERALGGQAGLWPSLLPQLRNEAGLKRSELVGRLAGALGFTDRTDKIAGYYHEMEQGLLPSIGVSDRVLEALSQLLGESAQSLREAGRALSTSSGPPGEISAAFARRAFSASAGAASPGTGPAVPERDEVDELFTDA